MRRLLLLGIAGLFAQLVDGSLGMSYGVSSTTLLLAFGVAPALASASVHISEVATTFASGVSHTRFGNVDWSKVIWMALPGAVGAFLGAVAISYIAVEVAEPVVAVFLFLLGVYILARFGFRRKDRVVEVRPIARRFLVPLGFVAGFLDAAGGGGWGPIGSSTLLSSGRMEPRKVVGTVDTSEFIVTVAGAFGFLLSLSLSEIPWQVVGALLVGGIVAAPIAAWLVRLLPARVMGVLVAGIILVTNAQTFLDAVGLGSLVSNVIYAAIVVVCLAAIGFAIWTLREQKKAEGEPA
ncbi:sulfite exporter TauE/SafE family protein [Rubrobacter calidifluminis]|uniref:sulfite exporter TauE/SafE family protein n=1 Tax=Rubrobacter calidifluminis TaxID=1392640 RepID=UPI00235F7DA8|nr:sulfite exporter TauE/SafE family protein [Rubrobacter calidifluminis]